MNANNLYYELRELYSLKELADKLHLHTGTLKRWESLQKIPENYLYDLNFLLGNKYKLATNSFRNNDEFFTKRQIAKYCYDKFLDFLKSHKINIDSYGFIEPSCGDCSFYDLMPKNKRIGIDLNATKSEILRQNFLDFKPDSAFKKCIILGNPPFGLRGNLALRFINHASFADFIAFILPPLFDSDGKGSPKGRVRDFTLIHSENLPPNSFIYPNGKEVEVATIFQIWVKKELAESLKIEIPLKKTCKKFIKVYSLSDGGTPSSTRNKKMLNACDFYLPSTCFHSKSSPQMKLYDSFEKLPNKRGYGVVILRDKEKIKTEFKKINWEKVSFLGTNSSLNLRTSLIENALIERGFCD